MKYFPVAVSLCALLGPAAFTSAAVLPNTQMPTQFIGEWNSPSSACGTSYSDAKLIIGASTIVFGESTGVIVRVQRRSATVVDLTARYSGEGERWIRTDRLTLSSSGQELKLGSDASGVVRQRCVRRPPHHR